MGLVGLLRVLWRRRIAVTVGALLASGIAVAGIQRDGAAPSASSVTKLLIDTPDSLVADARAPGARTIDARARLVASLLADDDAKAAIVRRAGLRPSEVAVAGPGAAAPPEVITPLAEEAIRAAMPARAYLVSVEVEPDLPIVSIDANAPDRNQAAQLGRAAVDALRSVARGAPGGGGSVAIRQLGRPLIVNKAAAGGKVKAVAGALALLSLWCLACVVADRAIRRRRLRGSEWLGANGAFRVSRGA